MAHPLSTTDVGSVKGRNLARGSRVSVCMDDERPPFTVCTVDETATLSGDPAELLVRVRPRHVAALRGISD